MGAQEELKPLEGKTTIDENLYVEPECLSYVCADAAAAQIARQVCVKDKTVVLATTGLLAEFATLNATRIQLQELQSTYTTLARTAAAARASSAPRHGDALERLRPEAVLEGMAQPAAAVANGALALVAAADPVVAGIQAALGVASLFREDVEYRGARTVVDALAFSLALAGHLKQNGATDVYIPDLTVREPVTGGGSLTDALGAVQAARLNVWAQLGPQLSELVSLEAQLERAVSSESSENASVDYLTERVSELRRRLEPLTAPLERTDRRFDDLENELNRIDERTGISALARLLRAEALKETVTEGSVYLHAAVVVSGGHHRISRSLLRTMFVGDGLTFMGSAVVRWAELSATGAIVRGGIVRFRSDGTMLPARGESTPSRKDR